MPEQALAVLVAPGTAVEVWGVPPLTVAVSVDAVNSAASLKLTNASVRLCAQGLVVGLVTVKVPTTGVASGVEVISIGVTAMVSAPGVAEAAALGVGPLGVGVTPLGVGVTPPIEVGVGPVGVCAIVGVGPIVVGVGPVGVCDAVGVTPLGLGLAVGVGLGEGDAVADEVGTALGTGLGVGDTVALGGTCVGAAVGDGLAVGVALGVGVGVSRLTPIWSTKALRGPFAVTCAEPGTIGKSLEAVPPAT